MHDIDELLTKVRDADVEALDQLIGAMHDRVYRLAQRVIEDPSLADDVAAEVFYKVWRKARQWSGQSSAAAWILRIAATTVLDQKRKHGRWWARQKVQPQPEVDPQPGPVEQLSTEERRRAVHRALGQLSAENRLIVHLYYFEELSLAEIALILETDRHALKMRLMRARRVLAKMLGEPEI